MRLLEFYGLEESIGSHYYTIQTGKAGHPVLLRWEEESDSNDNSYDVVTTSKSSGDPLDNITDIANELAFIFKKDQSFASEIMDAYQDQEQSDRPSALYVDRMGVDFIGSLSPRDRNF